MAFEGLLGPGSAAQQLLIYGVGYEIARAILGPMFTQIEYEINSNSQLVELSPPELADLFVRGAIAAEGDAATRAAKYGIDASKFHEMYLLAGNPPGLEQVLEMWRRGIVPTDAGVGAPSLAEAVRTSRLYSYWQAPIEQFQFTPISPADAVNAVQRNQITQDQGVTLSYFAGLGNAETAVPGGANTGPTTAAFQILLNTRGNPPSPGELITLANRGIIPWGNLDPAAKAPDPAATTFAQGIYEGDSKDKWLPFYAQLGVYIRHTPTIGTLVKSGAISIEQAVQYYEDSGLTPELADAYIASATNAKVVAAKSLNESAVVQLYLDKLIDEPTATANLELLGYDASEANLILQSAGLKQVMADLNRNIARVGNYYIARKIDEANARTMLTGLGLPAAQVDQYLTGWTIDRQANVRLLTAAQIADAYEYGIMDQATAQASLEADGYTPYDAWAILSIKLKTPQPGQPAPGPAPIQ